MELAEDSFEVQVPPHGKHRQTPSRTAAMPPHEKGGYGKGSVVKELNPTYFDPEAPARLIKPGCAAVVFYSPQCIHCKMMEPDWERFGKTCAFGSVYRLNCETHAAQVAKIREAQPELIEGFPTVVFYKDGEVVEKYTGDRTVNGFLRGFMRVCRS